MSEHELYVYLYTMLDSPRRQPWAIFKPERDGVNGGKLDWRSDEVGEKGDYLLVSEDGQ